MLQLIADCSIVRGIASMYCTVLWLPEDGDASNLPWGLYTPGSSRDAALRHNYGVITANGKVNLQYREPATELVRVAV